MKFIKHSLVLLNMAGMSQMQVAAPEVTGLRAEIYSSSTTGLFWDRVPNMNAISSVFLILAVVSVMLVTGCMPSEPNGVVGTAEEYVYKGRPDPLMAKSAVDRAEKLSDRFKLIQARQ